MMIKKNIFIYSVKLLKNSKGEFDCESPMSVCTHYALCIFRSAYIIYEVTLIISGLLMEQSTSYERLFSLRHAVSS